jgi:dimethylargininase
LFFRRPTPNSNAERRTPITPSPPLAITRAVPASIAACELTHLAREPIDIDRARQQHGEYEALLRECGYEVRQLPPMDEHPDSVFVEDAAIVLAELAVLCRPGAPSRRGEVAAVAPALEPYRRVVAMQGPGTLDGGDVLALGSRILVGIGSRTSPDGAAELRQIVSPYGYTVETIAGTGALHLKTAVSRVGPSQLLVNRDWLPPFAVDGMTLIDCDPGEPFAANAVWTPAGVIHSSAFPRTRRQLERAGVRVLSVDASELAKAEGGVTCCSLLVPRP